MKQSLLERREFYYVVTLGIISCTFICDDLVHILFQNTSAKNKINGYFCTVLSCKGGTKMY